MVPGKTDEGFVFPQKVVHTSIARSISALPTSVTGAISNAKLRHTRRGNASIRADQQAIFQCRLAECPVSRRLRNVLSSNIP